MRESHSKVPVLLFSCVLDDCSENQQITPALEVKKSHMRNLGDGFVKTGIFPEILFDDQVRIFK